MTAENIVLGTIVDGFVKTACDLALDYLTDTDFESKQNKIIFQAIRTLADAPTKVDLVTVTEKCLKLVDPVYITKLLEQGEATEYGFRHYMTQVKAESSTRKLKALGKRLSKMETKHLEKALQELDTVGTEIIEGSTYKQDSLKSIGTLADEYSINLEERNASRGNIGVTTTYSYLDHLVGSFVPGQLIIIAGQTGMGKSAFSSNIMARLSDYNIGSVLFSLEMSSEELMHRQIAATTGINSMDLQSGKMTPDQLKFIKDKSKLMKETPIYIDDYALPSVGYIKRKLKRLIAIDPRVKIAFIDYLQLMELIDEKNQNLKIAATTRYLKLLARDLKLPIVLLSQLNRDVSNNRIKVGSKIKKNRPTLANLRDSGAIEQDADVVLFTYRESEVEPNANPKEAEIIVAKCRKGKTGTVYLEWDGETTQFLESEVNDYAKQLPDLRRTEETSSEGSDKPGRLSAQNQGNSAEVEDLDDDFVPF